MIWVSQNPLLERSNNLAMKRLRLSEMIPVLLEGNDAIGIAQTGTGKTAAFLLPLLTFLSGIKSRPKKGKCDVLILTPTRELASQILENARKYGQNMKFASALIVGGARYEGQLRALVQRCEFDCCYAGSLD